MSNPALKEKTFSAILAPKNHSKRMPAEEEFFSMTHTQLKAGYREYTIDMKVLIDGTKVFKAIDTHGIPLDILLDRIYENNAALNWVEFIDAALEHGWLVYQIHEKIDYALRDSFYFQRKPEAIQHIKTCTMVYICKNVPEFLHLLK